MHVVEKRQKVRMCLAGAAVRADARSGRVPKSREATEFRGAPARESKSRPKIGWCSKIGPEGDKLRVQKFHSEAETAFVMSKKLLLEQYMT